MARPNSPIAWTDATWNPTTGCTHVSEGCRRCYAETDSLRRGWSKKPWIKPFEQENVKLHPNRLKVPLTWQEPKRIFVDSMSDLFHELIPDDYIDQVFAIMAAAPRHIFQILTKRPERMAAYLTTPDRFAQIQSAWQELFPRTARLKTKPAEFLSSRLPLPNVWLGTSVENEDVTERLEWLRQTPAVVHFVSAEPLLGPLDLTPWLGSGLEWVIAGGESGPEFRPLQLDWARSIREQCLRAGIPFFFKQVGGKTWKSGGFELDGCLDHAFPVAAR